MAFNDNNIVENEKRRQNCVMKCKFTEEEYQKTSFHSFPNDSSMKNVWLDAIGNRCDIVPSKNTRICSRHFDKISFHPQSSQKTTVLKKTAIPTIFYNVEMQSKKRKKDAACRGCLSSNNLLSLFTSNNLAELFTSLTSIKIEPDDDLPNMICDVCSDSLTSFDSFRQNCVQIDKELRSRKLDKKLKTVQNELVAVDESFQFIDTTPSLDLIKLEIDVAIGDRDDEMDNEIRKSDLPLDTESNNKRSIDHSPIKSETTKRTANKNIRIKKSPKPKIAKKDPTDDPIVQKALSELMAYKAKVAAEKSEEKNFSPAYSNNAKVALQYQCHICNRLFRYEERLQSHIREHDGKKAVTCDICDKEYSSWSGLRKHVSLMHQDNWNIRCEHCEKTFNCQSALSSHMTLHNGKPQHVCESCGKCFTELFHLKDHLLVHQTETPFECDICGKKFKSEKYLRVHKVRHTGIRNFTCPLCSKAFTTRPQLGQHMSSHSGIQKYTCYICQQSFRNKNDELAHMQMHSDDTYY